MFFDDNSLVKKQLLFLFSFISFKIRECINFMALA